MINDCNYYSDIDSDDFFVVSFVFLSLHVEAKDISLCTFVYYYVVLSMFHGFVRTILERIRPETNSVDEF